MNAVIEATLTANTARFTTGLNNAKTQVEDLEYQIRETEGLAIIGEKNIDQAERHIARLNTKLAETLALQNNIRVDGALSQGPGAVNFNPDSRARESAAAFGASVQSQTASARSLDGVTQARYRAMDAAKAEESAIRANIRAREAEIAATRRAATAQAATANIRYQRDLEASFRRPGAGGATTGSGSSSGGGAGGGIPDDGSFAAYRRRLLASAGGIGASDLLKGAGVGALVMGLRAAVNHAQQLRKEARELGNDLEPAVAATARLGDGFDRLKDGGMWIVGKISQTVVDGIDGLVAAGGALLGMGSVGENLAAIRRDPEIEAARVAKIQAEQQAKAAAAAKAEAEFSAALADLEQARVEALKEGLDTVQQIALAEEMVRLSKEDILKTQGNTVEAARAEKDLVEQQAELARLRRTREAEIAAEKEAALDLEQKREEQITAEKEKQLKKEEEIARKREQAAERVAAAEAKVAAARASYADALSDQSAASLSEVESGERGSPADRRRAAEVARLRERARQARDQGRVSLIGGETVSVADQLSTRANQVQSGIQSLNTSERNPLGDLQAAVEKSNEELAAIRESLSVVELG